MLRLWSIRHLYRQQWHWRSDKSSDNDIEVRSKIYDVYKYREDIHNIYSRAARSDHDNKHNKHDEEVRVKTINDEYIYR